MVASPPEILQHIFGYLHDDIETLRQCSLVMRDWSESSKAYRFASVSVSLERASPKSIAPDVLLERLERFSTQIVLDGRGLNQLIKNLHLDAHTDHTPKPSTVVAMTRVLQKLEAAKRLTLYGMDWSWFGDMRPVIHTFLHNIVFLHLENCRFPAFVDFVDVIAVCGQLDGLELTLPKFGSNEQQLDGPEVSQPRSLQIHGGEDSLAFLHLNTDGNTVVFLRWLMDPRCFLPKVIRAVRIVHVDKAKDVEIVGRVLQMLGESLRSLEIFCPENAWNRIPLPRKYKEHITFAGNTNLQRIRLVNMKMAGSNGNPLPGIKHVLEMLIGSESAVAWKTLENVELQLYSPSLSALPNWSDWSQLNDIFERVRAPKLRKVLIELDASLDTQNIAFLRAQLPWLSRAGYDILVICGG